MSDTNINTTYITTEESSDPIVSIKLGLSIVENVILPIKIHKNQIKDFLYNVKSYNDESTMLYNYLRNTGFLPSALTPHIERSSDINSLHSTIRERENLGSSNFYVKPLFTDIVIKGIDKSILKTSKIDNYEEMLLEIDILEERIKTRKLEVEKIRANRELLAFHE